MAVSNLQVGLAIAGGLVLAAVVAHGAWTSRKNKPRQAEPELPRMDPMDAAEPGFSNAELDEQTRDTLVEMDQAMILPTVDKHAPIDALIDVIAPLALEDVVSGDAVLAALPVTRRVGSKPLTVEGMNDQTRQWEQPQAGQRYSAVQVAIQLANRAGALNEIEYSEFVQKVHALADVLGGTPEFPEMLDEIARAKELDSFASEHDAQLGMLLRAVYAAWSPGYIQQHAARHGFVPGVIPGRMVLPASTPGLPPVLVLSFDTQAALADDLSQTAIRDLSLSLDVAQVSRHEQAFERMREVAQSLAKAMEGQVTDDLGQPLSDAAMDQISLDLQDLYNTLDARELSAGSVLARRLFA
jgi:hypothetical protein